MARASGQTEVRAERGTPETLELGTRLNVAARPACCGSGFDRSLDHTPKDKLRGSPHHGDYRIVLLTRNNVNFRESCFGGATSKAKPCVT